MRIFRTIFSGSHKRNSDALKATATRERIRADVGNAIGYCDTLNATTIIERPTVDVRTTRNYHGFQRGRNIVAIGRIRRCTKNVSQMCIGSAVFCCSYKRNSDALKATATRERIRADAHQLAVFDNRDTRQATATRERSIVDACNAVGNRDVRQTCAIRECIRADACYTIWNRDVRQTSATRECIRADACYTIWNRDVRQTCAIRECLRADACYTIWNRDALKATATIERTNVDACYAAGDRDALKATATRERISADASKTIRNNQFGNQFAIKIQITGIG